MCAEQTPIESFTDLSYLCTYTIDDDQTFEIDDAISLERIDNNYKVWIHIADPSTIIPIDSQIDIEAKKRASSIYLSNKIIPMIDRELVEKIISLKAGRKSKALSVSVQLNKEGKIIESNIIRSLVKPIYT